MTQILFDCDDVLLDWLSGFKSFVTAKLGNVIIGEPGTWSMADWLDVPQDQIKPLIAEFNASDEFGFLDAVEGSQDSVLLMKTYSDYRLHVITSCSSDKDTVALRRANLDRVFGAQTFDSLHCLDLGQSKDKILQAWRPGALWIEDNYKNALLGVEAGHVTWIRRRPHNRQFEVDDTSGMTWFSNWSDLF